MSALVRKIIVDSGAFLNNAPAESGTFELPEIIELYGNEALYLQSFHCVASWLSIDATNDTMYLIENGVTTVARAVKLPHAAYDADSLATQLQTALNGAGKVTPGQYRQQGHQCRRDSGELGLGNGEALPDPAERRRTLLDS